jgi:membrane protein insertase, YidC/Oxa1 family, C-terminal domain
VNKNTVLAFSLLLLTFVVFQDKFVQEKIFGKRPVPVQPANNTQESKQNPSVTSEDVSKKEIVSIKNNQKPVQASANIVPDTVKTQKEAVVGDTIWLENDKILCGISEVGARIISLKIKDYVYAQNKDTKDTAKQNVDLLDQGDIDGANLTINGQNFDRKRFSANTQEKHMKISKKDTKTLDFSCTDDGNNTIIKRFSFDGESYKIGFDVLSGSLDGKSIIVGWNGGITESEDRFNSGSKNASGVSEPRKVHVFDGKNVTHIQMKKAGKEEETGFYKWAAITSKYFMIAMVADTMKNADLLIDSYNTRIVDNDGKKQNPILNYGIQIRRTGDGNKESYWIFAGPSKFMLLNSFHEKFSKVLFGGWEWLLRADIWFPYICEITLWLLIWLNGIINDYGITILILTIITRVVTYPLSQSSMKSMSRMKDLQPKITHIRERYKTNPKKMNEEVMALYKQEGINPFNPGCLPMFLQMPILFALFIVLRKAIELRGAHTIIIPWVKDLSQPEALFSLSGIFPNGIPMYGSNVALMPVIMAILTFFQNKMTIKDPNQKMMIYFMPIFMLVLFNNFPAGLVLYWTFSNALGILQQYMLEKSLKGRTTALSAVQVQTSRGKPGGKKRK